jgi:DNA-directed RNA polymerase subunit RPC12/RpoP
VSKESIPIGMLCSKCDKYKHCRTLCTYAEQYVNQDYIAQHDALFSDKGIISSTLVEDFTTRIGTGKQYTYSCSKCKHVWQSHIVLPNVCPLCHSRIWYK